MYKYTPLTLSSIFSQHNLEHIYHSFNITVPLPAKKEGTKRIIAVGDSITEGYMSSDKQTMSWPAQLQNMLWDK